MNLREFEVFPDEIPPNDDLDLQLLWLQVLERTGVHLTGRDLAEAWLQYCWYPFNEYGYFLHNFERNIAPPVSSWYNNQFFSQSMGCPIRSEIWGMVAIGNPQLAMHYAYQDGTLDHTGEAVWAEQMLSAMEAEAFFESDINRLLDFGLEYIPATSKLHQCIQFVRSEYAHTRTWQDARRHMLERFGDPDASKAVQNLGLTVLALLYGECDFGTTLLIALNSSYDTDCTCATAGAILGMIGGTASIPEQWQAQAQDTFVIGIDITRPTNRISDLATDTCRMGVAIARTINQAVAIDNVPGDLDAERIPTASLQTALAISASYLGKPEITPLQPTELRLTVQNHSDAQMTGHLRLTADQSVLVTPSDVAMQVPAHADQDVVIQVQANGSQELFTTSTTIQARWEAQDATLVETAIGLAIGQLYLVVGPFWDLYDTTVQDAIPYYDPVTRRKVRPRDAENFNNYVNLDRAYIPETSFASLPEGRTCYAAEHKLPINDWMGTAGPACIYVVHDVEAAEEYAVHMMIGNNDGFRLWVNDVQVAESREPWYWMPYNHGVTVTMRKGTNRVVAKVIRRGGTSEFSLGYAKPRTGVRWFDKLVTRRIGSSS